MPSLFVSMYPGTVVQVFMQTGFFLQLRRHLFVVLQCQQYPIDRICHRCRRCRRCRQCRRCRRCRRCLAPIIFRPGIPTRALGTASHGTRASAKYIHAASTKIALSLMVHYPLLSRNFHSEHLPPIRADRQYHCHRQIQVVVGTPALPPCTPTTTRGTTSKATDCREFQFFKQVRAQIYDHHPLQKS